MRGACYNPRLTEIYDSLTDVERINLRQLLENGLTMADVAELAEQGLAEVERFGAEKLPGFEVVFCQSAAKDLELFGTGNVRTILNGVLKDLPDSTSGDEFKACSKPYGCLATKGPFRIVLGAVGGIPNPVVFAIAPVGISPCRRVWRYFDHYKAMDLLLSESLYFSRLDQLTGDPEEGRMPTPSKAARIRAFEPVFGGEASQAVADTEEIFRGTTYVCCWTRREHESYLAWKHYCGRDSGGFAICTTHRRLQHHWLQQRSRDPHFFMNSVGYLKPEDPLPNSNEGEQMFWKRHWFSDETELRLAIRRPPSGSRDKILSYIATGLPRFERIPVEMSIIASEIVLNPFASAKQQEEIRSALAVRFPNLIDRLRPSEIRAVAST